MSRVSENWYPTRLVERLSDDTFRVIRSDSGTFQPGSGQRYITLSHRWGRSDFLKLTTNNLSTLEKGLPISVLRKTFQEALIIAQRMHIPYVWIDSLCIIQSGDDLADWREESKTMGKVYSNSFCNVSADWGDESNGLFFERTSTSKLGYGPEIWREPPNLHSNHNILARFRRISTRKPDVSRWHPVSLLDLLEDMANSPLNHRGWVLQERLLAPRVLHFSRHQITWECAGSCAWEKAPVFRDELPDLEYLTGSILERYMVLLRSMQRLGLSDGVAATEGHRWQTLVEKYTRSDLTKHSDKLIAFSGIARQLAPFGGQYVAGLWVKSMPKALLWEARPLGSISEPGRRERPGEYFAPTFSWAAADGQVDVERPGSATASAVFIEHRDTPLSSASTEKIFTDHVFGPLTSPIVEVRVRGMLRSCRRVDQQLVPAKWRRGETSRSPTFGYACPSSSAEDDDSEACFENGRALRVSYDRISDASEDTNATMYYYTIIAYLTDGNNPDHYNWAYGLLLKSVDPSMARFARVGFVHHTPARHRDADVRVPLGNERELPAWNYDEATGEHTFYIV